jgi:hypothetical protein
MDGASVHFKFGEMLQTSCPVVGREQTGRVQGGGKGDDATD